MFCWLGIFVVGFLFSGVVCCGGVWVWLCGVWCLEVFDWSGLCGCVGLFYGFELGFGGYVVVVLV